MRSLIPAVALLQLATASQAIPPLPPPEVVAGDAAMQVSEAELRPR